MVAAAKEPKQGENIALSSRSNNTRPIVCVFCGAYPGTSPLHVEAAHALARILHQNNYGLVYGGGTVGVMGELAKTLVSLSGPDAVHGIIPEALLKFERNYSENGTGTGKPDPQKVIDEQTYGRTTVVKDMHTRKQTMAHEVIEGGPGSGFVALSGGYGTLEELMEIVTWNQLGIHAKPVVVFNVDGYWTGLLQWVVKAVDSGFIKENNSRIMVEAGSAEEVLERLRGYVNAEGRFNLTWDAK
ncbi:lysine decarboxylase-like protein-like protein [Teratosphaeria nubilosa]|uniref:Lysine decarboxylase-like protein-like protein n=1 Tax=Teratosphaeria nubilosa TaxID=161662 RepID=A0A6G1L5K6_9PEZI|nr:lysine decarboxylase-like protein-like protein [Teratosphaeria nubilosa]